MQAPSELVGPRWAPAVVAVGAALLVFVGLAWTDSPYAAQVSDLLTPISATLAFAAAAAVSATDLPWATRRAWRWIALGIASTVLGDLLWVLLDARGDVPFPSPADALYLATYPAVMWGLRAMPGRIAPEEEVRVLLDLALIGSAATLGIWDSILRPMSQVYADDPLGLLVAAASPVGDVLLLGSAAVALRRRPDVATGQALLLLAAGVVAWVAGDLAYAALSLAGDYTSGAPIDAAWVVGTLLMTVGARRQALARGGESALAATVLALEQGAMLLPLGAMLLGFGLMFRVLIAETIDQGRLGTLLGAISLCALVLVRETASSVRQTRLSTALSERNAELSRETERSERLLLNILPASIAEQLKDGRRDAPIAVNVPSATVLFADLVGFTALSAVTPPDRLLALLDQIFSRFDALAERHGLEKIKTIGDAYMAAAGVPAPRDDHAVAAARMALEMIDALEEAARAVDLPFALRVGVHTGPLVAGVVGHRKFSYDLWGDTVNTASRLESHGEPGRVHVSAAVRDALGDRFRLESRGEIDLKGKGLTPTWFLLGEEPAEEAP